jgi:undecaprenyl diphosphate synthase
MSEYLPQHIGFILDGNRRWAREQGLPTLKGHAKGYKQIKEVAMELFDRGVKYVSAYVFSVENWNRSAEEVSYLMNLVLKLVSKDLDEAIKKGLRVRILGMDKNLSPQIIKAIRKVEQKSADGNKGTLALCFNYSGQVEIAEACRKIVEEGLESRDITPEVIAEYLYTPEVPAVDLVVRTSGEQRLSNFMLWRAAYSELLFLDKYWPDMTKKDVSVILDEYSRRQRRFGK